MSSALRGARSTVVLTPIVALAVACSQDAPAPGTFSLGFGLVRSSTVTEPCRSDPRIQRVEARLFGPSGSPLTLGGWPKTLDCASGVLPEASAPEGSYQLEVSALGEVQGDKDVPLYQGRVPLTLPGAAAVEVPLQPQVAFISVAFAFEREGNLAPCDDEVDDLQIFVAADGGGRSAFRSLSVPCASGKFAVPAPLYPLGYAIQLDATARDTGLKLYTAMETRYPEKGFNEPFRMLLLPIGGRVALDWEFGLGARAVSACDDPEVAVQQVVGRIVPVLGGDPFEVSFSCASARPLRFPGARFSEGTELDLSLVAEGVQRFRGVKRFRMGPGETSVGTLRLERVGTATVTVSSRSPACTTSTQLLVEVREASQAANTPALAAGAFPGTGGSLPLVDLPFGEYAVTLSGVAGATTVCSVRETRTITARSNAWEPVAL